MLTTVVSLCGLTVVSTPALAQGSGVAEPAERPRFSGRTSVSLVEVPVVVSTREGQSVRGLEARDFALLESGSPREIVTFDAVDFDALPRDRASQPQVARDVPMAGRRRFVLLFDLSYTSPAALESARAASLTFLDQALRPTDLVAVATLSASRGATLLTGFTGDRAQARRAVMTLGIPSLVKRPPPQDPLGLLVEDPSPVFDVGAPSTADAAAVRSALADLLDDVSRRGFAHRRASERRRAQRWVEALDAFARPLASVAGIKRVVLFSSGFGDGLLSAGLAPRAAGSAPLGRRGGDDRETSADAGAAERGRDLRAEGLRRRLQEAIRALERADATVWSIDAAGLDAPLDGAARGSGREALRALAEDTGGRLIADTNALADSLDRLGAESQVVYILGFSVPADAVAGRWRPIDVRLVRDEVVAVGVDGAGVREVKASRLRVRHRTGYQVPRAFRDLPELEKELLASTALLSSRPPSDLPVEAVVTPLASPGRGVAVLLEIGPAPLGAAARSRSDRKSPESDTLFEIYSYAVDATGRVIGVDAQTLSFAPHQRPWDRGVAFLQRLALPAGKAWVRTLVRDGENGRSSVVIHEVDVPRASESRLLPPLLLSGEAPDTPLESRRLRARSASAGQPFVVDGRALLPTARRRLAVGEPIRLYTARQGETAAEPDTATAVEALRLVARLASQPEAGGDRTSLQRLDDVALPLRLERRVTVEGVSYAVWAADSSGLAPGEWSLAFIEPSPAMDADAKAAGRRAVLGAVTVEPPPEAVGGSSRAVAGGPVS